MQFFFHTISENSLRLRNLMSDVYLTFLTERLNIHLRTFSIGYQHTKYFRKISSNSTFRPYFAQKVASD